MVTDTETVGTVADPGKLPRLSGLLSRLAEPRRWPGTPHGGRRSRAATLATLSAGQAEGDGEADPEGMASTARISEGPFEHFDASPVRRIWGVS